MDQTTDAGHLSGHHNDDAPFAEQRSRYLRHCAERGATPFSLRTKRSELLWIATRLGPDAASEGIDIDALRRIAIERQQAHGAVTAARRVVDIGRPWLRFLGWWREPSAGFGYQNQLDEYVRWMRDERGFTLSTLEQWTRVIGRFLRWCEQTNRQLGALQAADIDAYFVTQATGRWSRVSVANTASALRGFLRYAGKRGMCADSLAGSICRPRLYRQESLPYAPDWSDVQRMLADAETDKPRDIRDRAILLLLAVYGMRSGEVVALRLDQIDWAGRTPRLFRLKRRQPQIYPLVSSVAEALRQNYNVQFVTAATLVAMLAKAHADGSLDKQLTTLSRPKLLIIDELGYLPFEANAAHLFFQLVSRRYEKGSILITSNRSVGEWGSVFGDPVVATAILDRLLHHSTVITIRGDSYRLREKRRSGLLQKVGPALETNETANQ